MKNFNKNGYYVKQSCFSKEELYEVIKDTHNLFIQQMEYNNFKYTLNNKDLINTQSLFKFYESHKESYIAALRAAQRLISVYKIAINNKMIKTLKDLGIANPNFNVRPIITMKSKYTAESYANWKIPPHQDYRSMQGSLNSIVVWIPLLDVEYEHGPVEAIPGSHNRGLLPSIKDEWYRHIEDKDLYANFVSVPMKSGDCLFFSSLLIHKSGENKSLDFRYSLEVRFDDFSEESFIKEKYFSPYSVPIAGQELINKSVLSMQTQKI